VFYLLALRGSLVVVAIVVAVIVTIVVAAVPVIVIPVVRTIVVATVVGVVLAPVAFASIVRIVVPVVRVVGAVIIPVIVVRIVVPIVRFVGAVVVPDLSIFAVGVVRVVLALGRRRLVALPVGACRTYATRLAAGRQRHPDDGDRGQHPERPGLLHLPGSFSKVTRL
jgi:hypothetical protein